MITATPRVVIQRLRRNKNRTSNRIKSPANPPGQKNHPRLLEKPPPTTKHPVSDAIDTRAVTSMQLSFRSALQHFNFRDRIIQLLLRPFIDYHTRQSMKGFSNVRLR